MSDVLASNRYASESCHYYTRDGKPCYEVPNASKGGMRPTTLRDARKLNLVPSVSTILGVVAKPALNGWSKEQVAKAAYASPPQAHESLDEWMEYILRKADENMTKARDLGTEIHGAIEEYFSSAPAISGWAIPESPYAMHISAAKSALIDLGVLGETYYTEKSFACAQGYGGKVDLCGSDWIVDFKCVDRLDKKLDYPDRCQQLAAYADGLFGLPTSTRLANIFISTSEPGKYLIRAWNEEEMRRGHKVFQAAFKLWQEVNNYRP
jgi:hypothetical protein